MCNHEPQEDLTPLMVKQVVAELKKAPRESITPLERAFVDLWDELAETNEYLQQMSSGLEEIERELNQEDISGH